MAEKKGRKAGSEKEEKGEKEKTAKSETKTEEVEKTKAKPKTKAKKVEKEKVEGEKAEKAEKPKKTRKSKKTETEKTEKAKKAETETKAEETEKVEKIEKAKTAEEVVETEETGETEEMVELEKEVKPALDPELKRLMKVRLRQKARKPEFKRYESHKKLRLRDKSWRRPRGMDNKLRKRIAGKKPVSVGFGTPAEVRHLHPSGYREVLVSNPAQLEGVDAEREAIRVASSVGLRKRLAIEDKAKELGIKILNPLRVS